MTHNSKTHLLIDIGNSRIKWGISPAQLQTDFSQLLITDAFDRGENLNQQCQHAWGAAQAPEKILISSVAGDDIYNAVSAWCAKQWNIKTQRFQSQTQACGVRNAYENAAALGADRWAGLIAAYAHYKEYVLIADCGTATTLDVLGADGQHLGGYILPGLVMMRNALHRGTHALPTVDDVQNLAPADNTHDAIAAGTTIAIISSISQVSSTISAQIQQPLTVVMTGGNAAVLASHIDDVHYEPHLVLKGLAIACHQENTLQ